MNKAIQSHAEAPSETDSYERASAFLSGWIEESLLVPTAKAAQPPQRHRPLSPPGLDLPLPSSRALRRRITVSNGDNINSLVTSLQTSLMLHEHQNQNRPTHHRLNISPTYVGTVLHKEPSSRRGRAAIIPTLPFCERPQQPSVPSSSNPPGRDHQRGGVPSVRSVSAAPSQTKRRSRTALCSSLRSRSSSGGGRRRRNCDDAPLKSQSQFEDVKDKRGSNKHRSKSSKNHAGQVDELAQPNDSGSLPTTHTSSPESSSMPSQVVEKEVIKGVVTDTVEVMKTATATVKEDVHPSRKRGDEKKSSSKPKTKPSRKKSRRHTMTMATEGDPFATTRPSSLEASLPLDRLSDLDGPNFDLGDTFHSPKQQIIESSPTRAVHLINQLRIHDFAWILRSSNEWTYGIVADFPERGVVPSIRFVIDKVGNTKTFKMKHWAKCIRLVDYKSQSQKQK